MEHNRADEGPINLELTPPKKSELMKIIGDKLAVIANYTDEVLPEYIIVMVQNKKDKKTISADLEAFLGSQTKPFVDWFWEMLLAYVFDGSLPTQEQPKRQLSSVIAKPDEMDVGSESDDDRRGRRRRNVSSDRIRSRSEEPKLSSVISSSTPKSSTTVKSKGFGLSPRLLLSAVEQSAQSTKEKSKQQEKLLNMKEKEESPGRESRPKIIQLSKRSGRVLPNDSLTSTKAPKRRVVIARTEEPEDDTSFTITLTTTRAKKPSAPLKPTYNFKAKPTVPFKNLTWVRPKNLVWKRSASTSKLSESLPKTPPQGENNGNLIIDTDTMKE